MITRMAEVGRRMLGHVGICAAATLVTLRPTFRAAFDHLMLLEQLQNEARALGIDVAEVDRIVSDVHREWLESPYWVDVDAAQRDQIIRDRWYEVRQRSLVGNVD